MKRLLILKGYLLTICFYPLFASYAQDTQTDFNADGVSEFGQVVIQNDKSLAWRSVSPDGNSETALGTLGVSGNHLIPARWKVSDKPQIGVVSLNDAGRNIIWKIMNDNSTTEERQFGARNNTIISGADFNGSGVADAAHAKLNKKTIIWNIAYDIFFHPAGQAGTRTIRFGRPGDRIFYASPDGISDWIGVIGLTPNKRRTLVRLRSLLSNTVVKSNRFPASLSRNTRPRPFPIKQADGTDILGFAIQRRNDTRMLFRTMNGAVVSNTIFPGKGDIVVGNFISGPAEQVAIKTNSGYTVFDPFTQNTTEVQTVSGIAFDHININTLQAPKNSNPGGGGGGSNPPSGGLSGVCKGGTRSVSFGVLYKPSADAADSRQHKPVLLLQGSNKTSNRALRVFAANGKEVCKFTFKSSSISGVNGGADHYFSGWSGGCGKHANQIANDARAASGGNSNVYIEWKNNQCLGPINPTSRVGGIG